MRPPPRSTLFPYTTLFRSLEGERKQVTVLFADLKGSTELLADRDPEDARRLLDPDRKSTRLNSSHLGISYAVFCLKKKKKKLSLAVACVKTTQLTIRLRRD